MNDDPPPELAIDLVRDDDRAVLSVGGEVDLHTAGRLAAALEEVTAAAPRVVLDLTGVGFMDSSGLRLLLQTRRALEAEGRPLTLVLRPGGVVERLLDLANVLDLFERADAPPGRRQDP